MLFVILQVYDRIIPNQAVNTFLILIAALAVVALIEFMLRVFRSYILGWESSRFEHCKGMDTMQHILHLDNRYFEDKPNGYFLDRITALDEVQRFYSGEALLLAVDLPFAVIFFLAIWRIAGSLVLVPATLLGILLVTSMVAGSHLYKAINKRQEMGERRQNFLIEVLKGSHTVKSMAMEPFMMRRHERLQKQSAESAYELARINSLIQGTGASFSQLLFLDGVYVDRPDGTTWFRWVKAPTSQELTQLAHTIAHRVGRYLERQGLLERDAENSYLAGDVVDGDSMSQLHGHSITYRIAVGPHQGRKVFTLQTLPAGDPEDSFGDTVGKVAGF